MMLSTEPSFTIISTKASGRMDVSSCERKAADFSLLTFSSPQLSGSTKSVNQASGFSKEASALDQTSGKNLSALDRHPGTAYFSFSL